MPKDDIAIRVQNLTRVYAKAGRNKTDLVANNNLSFEVRRGEIFGLLGENGAGKTTLVMQLLGLLAPTSGEIWLEGVDVVRQPDHAKALMGFLPQTSLPLRYLEVWRALYFTGRLRGQPEAEARRQTDELLASLDLLPYANRYVHKLSGGLLRMTNFGMALMGHPRVVVLDEPTNNLDPERRRQVWATVTRLNREHGLTCVLVTHNVLEAERVIQRVMVMQAGQIVASGTPGELKLSAGGQVRFEFYLKDAAVLTEADHTELSALGLLEQVQDGHFVLSLPAHAVPQATNAIVNGIGLTRLDDFHVALPSLEDVYLSLKHNGNNHR
jgi:ABC-2 type transport system permease protein